MPEKLLQLLTGINTNTDHRFLLLISQCGRTKIAVINEGHVHGQGRNGSTKSCHVERWQAILGRSTEWLDCVQATCFHSCETSDLFGLLWREEKNKINDHQRQIQNSHKGGGKEWGWGLSSEHTHFFTHFCLGTEVPRRSAGFVQGMSLV